MKIQINEIYQMINWKSPPAIKTKGIQLAKKIIDLSLLIRPPAEPSVWECCAEILSDKDDFSLEPYLDDLLDWLQDLNWPGALTILDRLKFFSGQKLKKPFMNRFEYAKNLNNEEGKIYLYFLSELLDNESLRKELPEEVVMYLKSIRRSRDNQGTL